MLLSMLVALGFVANEDKCDPPSTSQVFLGVGMNSALMMYFFTAERLDRIRRASMELEHAAGLVRVSKVMSVLGHWMFMAQVVRGLGLYLRSGYACIGSRPKTAFVRLSRSFRADLAFLRRLIAGDSLTVSMVRKPLTSGFAAWDACTGWGMGGYLDGMYFSVSWRALAEGVYGQTHTFYPFMLPGTEHINYLELFAAYWFLRLWGGHLRGYRIVCFTDNTATEGMLKNLWGTPTFIPLLKEILRLLVRFDLELDVHRIGTKENVLADCLSRGAMDEFHGHAAAFVAASGVAADQEDWQLLSDAFRELDAVYGPFQVDACVDAYRTNAHCAVSWTEREDCLRQRWHGLTVFCNGPFSRLFEILTHFLRCKAEEPVGTAALFILPMWSGSDFMGLVHSHPRVFRVVARYPAGSALFSAPVPSHLGGGRRYVGPTRWPVLAVWAGPEA